MRLLSCIGGWIGAVMCWISKFVGEVNVLCRWVGAVNVLDR